jgi:hypothetical protein
LLIVWWLNFFDCRTFMDLGCSINGGLIPTIDLATEFGLLDNKMYTLHVNFHFFFWNMWALCCLTATIAIYLGRVGGWNLMGVWILDHHIAFTIGAKFQF